MFAVFFETAPVQEGHPQYLVFPVGTDEAVVFQRISDGGRTGHNRWSVTNHIPDGEVLTKQPSALIVTATDVRQYEDNGLPATLTTKAQTAHSKAPDTDETTDSLSDIVERVGRGDASLGNWVRDGRRTRPVRPAKVQVRPAPNTATPAPVVVPVPVTPEAQVSDTFVQPDVEVRPQPIVNTTGRMAMVPAPEVATKYVHRTIAGVQDFDIFAKALGEQKNVLLYGPTGPGKTTSAIAFASANNLPVFMVSGTVSLEASQLFGRYIPDGQGGFVWQDGGVTECVRHGGVLILDEINFIPSKIATVLFSLLADTRHITLLDHKGETIQAHPNLLVVGTMNPDYAGTQEMNAALRNRFRYQISWGYDDNVEKVLVPFKSLRTLAGQLRAAEANEELLTPTPTNALVDFVDIAQGLGIDFAVANFIARYADDEQAPVKKVIETHRANIEADLGLTSAPVTESEESDDAGLRDLGDIDLTL